MQRTSNFSRTSSQIDIWYTNTPEYLGVPLLDIWYTNTPEYRRGTPNPLLKALLDFSEIFYKVWVSILHDTKIKRTKN